MLGLDSCWGAIGYEYELGDPHYYLTDHLGSPRVIANGDGTVVSWESDYWPYGGDIPVSNVDGSGCPSIRAKALSSTEISWAMREHRVVRQRG